MFSGPRKENNPDILSWGLWMSWDLAPTHYPNTYMLVMQPSGIPT